jgi:hypothetical protein
MPGLYNIRDNKGRFAKNEPGIHLQPIGDVKDYGFRFYQGRISKRSPKRKILAIDLFFFRLHYAW